MPALCTTELAASQLNVRHVEVPESQVVGEHVELGQEGGPGLVDGGDLVEAVDASRSMTASCQRKAKRSLMTVPSVFSSSSAFCRVVRGWRPVMASSSGRKVNRKNSFSSSGTPSRSEVGERRGQF